MDDSAAPNFTFKPVEACLKYTLDRCCTSALANVSWSACTLLEEHEEPGNVWLMDSRTVKFSFWADRSTWRRRWCFIIRRADVMLCLFSGLQIPGGSLQLWIFTAESSCACFIYTQSFVCGNFSCVCLSLVDAVDNLIAASVASGFGKQYQGFLLYLSCRWCQIGLFLPIWVSYCKTVGARFLIFMPKISL